MNITQSTKTRAKAKFSTELSYVLGLTLLALASALIEGADLGVSMVVAPAYILHLKLSEIFPFFTFGVAEYTTQAILLVIMIVILRRFKISYLFSFVTAVVYGMILDLSIYAVSSLNVQLLPARILLFCTGIIICSFSIALLFHTYISPEVYELLVKEVAKKFGYDLSITKTVYDLLSLVVSVLFSFLFFGFGNFVGIGIGTIVCAVANGPLIGVFSRLLEKKLDFADTFTWRKYFE